MQCEGIQAAKTSWNLYHERDDLIPKAPEIFEKLIDFYIFLVLSWQKYEVALRENENLQKENKIIMDILRELRCSIRDNRKDMKEMWNEITDRQTAINKDMGEGIRDFFREMKG
jgi:hypothetical protein